MSQDENKAMLDFHMDTQNTTAELLRSRLQFGFDHWLPDGGKRTKRHLADLCRERSGNPCSPQDVQGWFTTGRMDKKWIPILASVLGVDLLTGEPARTIERDQGGTVDRIDWDEFTPVRRMKVEFSNGHGKAVYAEDEHPPLVFRSDFLRSMGVKEGNAVVVSASGMSNEPKIVDGSVVLVNRGDNQRLNGDLFAFRVDGELLIKRLEKIEGVGILATADNPNFKPKIVVYKDMVDFEVIGRAVWTGAVL